MEPTDRTWIMIEPVADRLWAESADNGQIADRSRLSPDIEPGLLLKMPWEVALSMASHVFGTSTTGQVVLVGQKVSTA